MNENTHKKPTPFHHSVDDWDFLLVEDWSDFEHWGLTDFVFVSPPTSLNLTPGPLELEVYALSKLPQTLNLIAGSITSWAQRQGPGVGIAHFYIGVTGAGDRGIALVITTPTGIWNRNRRDWWQGWNRQNEPATLVLSWTWLAGNWTAPSLSFHPPMSGAINRVGIGCTTQSLFRNKYYDDTEIWIPA